VFFIAATHLPAVRCMDFPNRRQVAPREVARQPDERRPQPSMHVRDLSADEPADQDIGRVTYRARQPEDLLSFGMAPPAPAYASSCDCLGEIRNRAPCAFEDDAVALYE